MKTKKMMLSEAIEKAAYVCVDGDIIEKENLDMSGFKDAEVTANTWHYPDSERDYMSEEAFDAEKWEVRCEVDGQKIHIVFE